MSRALAVLTFATVMVGTTLPSPLYPLYERQFGFGAATVTLVFAAYAAGQVIATLTVGSWSDIVGRRPMVVAAVVLSALSAGCFLLASSESLLFVGRFLSGLSAGTVTTAATAWLVDLAPGRPSRGALAATAANIGGLGIGSLFAGLAAQYAPSPLRLCYAFDLGLLVISVPLATRIPETVGRSGAALPVLRRPKVPAEARAVFAGAAFAGFAGFAVLGLFSSLASGFLAGVLHRTNHALAGAVVLAAFAASLVGQLLAGRLGERRAVVPGVAGLVLGLALVAGALTERSLVLLVGGILLAGTGQGLGFRSGLALLAGAVPADRRAETDAAYFVVLYVGSCLPVIGLGLSAGRFGLVHSGITFAAAVAVVAALTLTVRPGRSRNDSRTTQAVTSLAGKSDAHAGHI